MKQNLNQIRELVSRLQRTYELDRQGMALVQLIDKNAAQMLDTLRAAAPALAAGATVVAATSERKAPRLAPSAKRRGHLRAA